MRGVLQLLLICLLAAVAYVPTAFASTKRVAVLPLTNSAGAPAKQIAFLTQVIRQEGINALAGGPFQILTQANLESLLPPGKTLADCIDECAIKTGRNLKAHYVITGQLQKAAGSYRLMLGLYATRKGTYLDALTLVGGDILQLEQQIKRRARAAYATIRTDAQGSRFALGGSGAIVMTTDAPKPITMTKRPSAHEFVAFNSSPSGAWVVLNGQRLCQTPCQRVVPNGEHQVTLQHDCFEDRIATLVVGGGAGSKASPSLASPPGQPKASARVLGGATTSLPFRPKSADIEVAVRVEGSPPAAVSVSDGESTRKIALDGDKGALGFALEECAPASSVSQMKVTPRELIVSAAGYVSVKKAFDVARLDRERWGVTLKAVPSLTVECDDRSAALYQGDQRVGVGQAQLTLDPGEYRFSCGLPNAAESSQSVTLAPGDKPVLQLKAAAQGKITLECAGEPPVIFFGARDDAPVESRIERFEATETRKTVQLETTPGLYDAYCVTPGGTVDRNAVRVIEGADETIVISSQSGLSACHSQEILTGFGYLIGGGLLIAVTVGTAMSGYAAVGGLIAFGGPATWIKAYSDDGPCKSRGGGRSFGQERASEIWPRRYLYFSGFEPKFVGSDVTNAADKATPVTAAKPEKGVTASNYNSRAWEALVAGDAEAAERAVRTGLVLEPQNVYLLTNMAHVHLFSGRYDAAYDVLKTWAKRRFYADDRFETYRDGFLDDYKIFKEKGSVPEAHRRMFQVFYRKLRAGTIGR